MVDFENPPLTRFSITFYFNEIKPPSIKELGKLEDSLIRQYSIAPRIQLFASDKLQLPVNIGPLQYLDQNKTKEIKISATAIAFTYFKYTNWNTTITEVFDTLKQLSQILQFDSIINIYIQYIDEFIIDRESFLLEDYFNIKLSLPQSFDPMSFEDFHFGFIPQIKSPNKRLIVRLRGIPPENSLIYKFHLETELLIKDTFIFENDSLNNELNSSHALIIRYFKELLGVKTRSKLGFKE